MKVIYQLSVFLYSVAANIFALFNEKAKMWVKGRRNLLLQIQNSLVENETRVWFHCASLGEYEQAIPIIQAYKKAFAEHRVVVTFFSPSGYNHKKEIDEVDYYFYLPIDTAKNAKTFISVVNPQKAFFVKYEFWYFYLKELHNKNVPTYLVSGIFRENQLFFKSYGRWYKNMLNYFSQLFVQDEQSKNLLNSIGINNVIVAGDSRFDRVCANSLNVESLPLIEKFKAENKLLVGGSTWQKEEEIIKGFCDVNNGFKIVLAPHDISKKHIESIEKLFGGTAIKYSVANEELIKGKRVLIIDNIGILSFVYQYADVSFVGGGFSDALHNILEPAVYNHLVVFGPNHAKFPEAKKMVEYGAAAEVNSEKELEEVVNDIVKEGFVERSVGCTKTIMDHL